MECSISFTSKLPRIGELMAGEAARVARVGATATSFEAKASIREAVGSGIHHPGLPNRSSAPGATPVDQFHDLVESIHVPDEVGVVGTVADAVASSDHAEPLELGTSRIAPRPFMGPAAEKGGEAMNLAVAEIPERLEREL